MLRDCRVHQVVCMHLIQHAVHLHRTAWRTVSTQSAHCDPTHTVARRSLHWCLQVHLSGRLHNAVCGWRHCCASGKDVMLGCHSNRLKVASVQGPDGVLTIVGSCSRSNSWAASSTNACLRAVLKPAGAALLCSTGLGGAPMTCST